MQRRKRRSTSSCNSGNGACKALGRGLMTMDHCGLSRARERRTASRSRRLIRLRATALPRARETVKPIRGPLPSGSRTQKAAKNGHENRLPFSYTLRKSCGRSRRTRFGKPAMENYLSELTESFLRPRARRRDSTARPSCVFMRVRKPCVLARRRLLGWNVRFGILFQFTSIKQPKRTGKPRNNRSDRDKPGIVFRARALRGWKSNSPGLGGQNQGGEGGFAGGRLLRHLPSASSSSIQPVTVRLSKYRPSCVKVSGFAVLERGTRLTDRRWLVHSSVSGSSIPGRCPRAFCAFVAALWQFARQTRMGASILPPDQAGAARRHQSRQTKSQTPGLSRRGHVGLYWPDSGAQAQV